MILGTACASTPAIPERPDVAATAQRIERMTLVTRMQLSTVFIFGKTGRSSGVIVAQESRTSLVLTAAHSARNFLRGQGDDPFPGVASTRVGRRIYACPFYVAAIDEEHDLALLRTCRLPGVPAKLAPAPPDTGSTVYLVGSPLGEIGRLSQGIVSKKPTRNIMLFTASAHLGSSGGPVFDAQGKLVGIMSSITVGPILHPELGPHPKIGALVSTMPQCVSFQAIRIFLIKQRVEL